jgi:hypothetical protein
MEQDLVCKYTIGWNWGCCKLLFLKEKEEEEEYIFL